MLKLTAEEQTWPDAYRADLEKKHRGVIREMLIYESKARGQALAESDVDVLLIVKNDAAALKRDLPDLKGKLEDLLRTLESKP
jgi:predicted nucleotidyltransferase